MSIPGIGRTMIEAPSLRKQILRIQHDFMSNAKLKKAPQYYE